MEKWRVLTPNGMVTDRKRVMIDFDLMMSLLLVMIFKYWLYVFPPFSKVFYPSNIFGKTISNSTHNDTRFDFVVKKIFENRKSENYGKNSGVIFKVYFYGFEYCIFRYKIFNSKSIYDFNRTHFSNLTSKIASIHVDIIVKTLSNIGGEIFILKKNFLF